MTLMLAVAVSLIFGAVVLLAAYAWRNEINAFLRSIERY